MMVAMNEGTTDGWVDGIDGCSLQLAAGPIDWPAVKAAGFSFVYWKASQYSSTHDRTFGKTIEEASKAGLAVGAYHFCAQNKPEAKIDTPEKQAEFFYKASDGVGSKPGEMPPMIDWEFCSHNDHEWCVEWLERFAARAEELWYPDNNKLAPNSLRPLLTGSQRRRPVIYTYPYYARKHKDALESSIFLENFPLCLASYKSDNTGNLVPWYPPEEGLLQPKHAIPKPWEMATLVQYSGNNGRPVPGIKATTDRDAFLGSVGEFQDFLGLQRPVDSVEGEVK